jgi:hypothetical protein
MKKDHNHTTPPHETAPSPAEVLKLSNVFAAAFDLPDPISDVANFGKEKSQLEEQRGANEPLRQNIYSVPDNFTPSHEVVIRRTAQDLRMHDFITDPESGQDVGQDPETPLKGEFEALIVPAGRNGIETRLSHALKSINDGTASVTGPIILVGSGERHFASRNDGSENPELTYFKKNYPEAHAKLMEEKGKDYTPTEYDLVAAQASALREQYTNLTIHDVEAIASDGDGDGVYSYTVAKKAFDFLVENFMRGDASLAAGMSVAFSTNQIYQVSTGNDFKRAAREYGIEPNKVFVAGLAAPPENSRKRNLTAYFREILTAMRSAGKFVAEEQE